MRRVAYLLTLVGLFACKQAEDTLKNEVTTTMDLEIEERYYGLTEQGDTVTSYTLSIKDGMSMEVMNYGGIIISLTAPDREGNFEDVALGFDSLGSYLHRNPFFGALVGRYGNRIAGGKFSVDGEEYSLVQNNGDNHLHGGTKGFDKKVWEAETSDSPEGPKLELTYTSTHMEEGYPGELKVRVTYLLRADSALQVDYEAITDRPTIVNLTQHSYFNLNPDREHILDHRLILNADRYLPVDEGLIPLGPLEEVAGTPFDFRQPHTIGERINEDHPQLKIGGGYDHCWVLSGSEGELKTAAVLYDPATGREMTVETTEPGVQFYSSNFFTGELEGKGRTFVKHGGLCLETQHFPDSPNQPEYPSTRLDPGETYRSTTVFKFGIK